MTDRALRRPLEMKFTPQELSRYARHLSLEGFGPEAQEKLKRGRVLVIGAGGLGCPALLYLAAAGVGRIIIMDGDRVDVSNLQRQVLYSSDDAGRTKAGAAARRLRGLNPLIDVVPVEERFTRDNALERLRDVDVVVDGSDNFSTRYLVNDACVLAGKPFVYGAIQGFEGQASVFNYKGGPTYRCLFPEPPEPGSVPNCSEAGVLGVLPGLIGTVQATEAIKLLTGIGEPLSGRLLLWDSLAMTSRVIRLAADPARKQITGLPLENYGATCMVSRMENLTDEIEASELQPLLGKVQLIDVREDWERAMGAIQPSAHLPLGQLTKGLADAVVAALDPKKPTVAYCAHGMRSLRAMQVLRERHGFSQVQSLKGGYEHWKTL